MRSDSDPAVQKTPTFIEQARRAQIVSVAIETIAEVGYAQASLAQIAARAGISKGVIAYHFAGKQDLISAVVAEVLARAEEFMRPRIAGHSTGPDVLRAYIESNLAFMGDYRNHVVAILEIARGTVNADSGPHVGGTVRDAGVVALSKLLANYQKKGQLRPDFDPHVMAMAIRAAIDAVPRRFAGEPKLDLDHVGRELADLFGLATRTHDTRSH